MLSLRNADSSDSGAIYIGDVQEGFRSLYISVLLASGFRQKDDSPFTYIPCPLGTFTDPSTTGKESCQNCSPGNF